MAIDAAFTTEVLSISCELQFRWCGPRCLPKCLFFGEIVA